ncbi:MAG: DNA methyltransferase, partial [Pseudomonas sp.]
MPLSWNDIKSRALTFSKTWANASREDSEAKPFWFEFFNIFGITNKRAATFEYAVKKLSAYPSNQAPDLFGHMPTVKTDGFIDLFWPGVLLVEHKSRGKDLDKALNQAMSYLSGITERDLPQLIVVCDFARFRIHSLETQETVEFLLEDLHKEVYRFGLLAGYKVQRINAQSPVNIRAAERMGKLHDALKDSGYDGHKLEVLLVRLLFCLFADDTGIFHPAQAMRAFIEERTNEDGSDLGPRLAQLFQVLNTPTEQRNKTLDEQLAAFPYVNGKLFAETLPMADFNRAMREALLEACALDWSGISPAIFGSLFQSIMNDTARRNLGAHYTSEENILKLIKPLFLDELRAEFEKIKTNYNKLLEFHTRLRELTFFDPACGCGNFLVITYRELRLLELELLLTIRRLEGDNGQQLLDIKSIVKLDVDQFYGIEIEEFPAQIAQVALWLVDHQMNLLVSKEFGLHLARIPLQNAPNISHGNALRLEWNTLLPAKKCSYILGNPPFVGAKYMNDAQREDSRIAFMGLENAGLLDIVAAWYVKAARYMANNKEIQTAFVSTNSITQGEQVGVLWGWMLGQGIHINFAHRTFKWTNEARGNAAVHCVIVGFSLKEKAQKIIFEYSDIKGEPMAIVAQNINPYLVDAQNVILSRRRHPVCRVPEIGIGNQPIDDGNYLFTPKERDAFIQKEPYSLPFFRRWLGADEFLNGHERWCLWLGNCSPAELRKMPEAMKRVQAVKEFRSASRRVSTKKLADTPTRFQVENMPGTSCILLPRVSSERRLFIPIGYIDSNT